MVGSVTDGSLVLASVFVGRSGLGEPALGVLNSFATVVCTGFQWGGRHAYSLPS